MSREALRQQLDDLYREISDCKISAENYENHPSITSQIIAKNPVANLRIPAKLFVLWSELKSIQVPTPTYVDLVRYSLKDNSGFTMFPNAKNLKIGFVRNAAERARSTEAYVGITPRKDWERLRNASSYMPTRELCNCQMTSTAPSPALYMKIMTLYLS